MLFRSLALRGGVEEVDAETEGFADGGDGVAFRDGTEDAAERGSSEAHATEFKARVSERSQF